MFNFFGIDSWTLQKGKSISPSNIFYQKDTANRILANVTGTRTYRVEVVRELDLLSGTCTCPAYDHNELCKHIAAVCLNPPPFFTAASKSDVHYTFDRYDEEEEDDWVNRPPLRTTSPTKNAIELLEMESWTNHQAFSINDFYEGGFQETVYQLSHDYRGQLHIYLKNRQLLKNGTWGKIKSFSGDVNRVVPQLRPFLVREYYSDRLSHAVIPAQEIRSLLPDFIKNNLVIDEHERPLKWLETKYHWKIVTDTKNRSFEITSYFSDKVERRGVWIDPENGFGFVEDSIFLSDVNISLSIYDALKVLQGKKLSVKDWESFRKIILNSYPKHLCGDKFEMEILTATPKFYFHFKYLSSSNIQAVFIKEIPTDPNVIYIEEENCFGFTLNVPFVINHQELVSLITELNEKGIEIKSFHKRVHSIKKFGLKVQGQIDWFETSLEADIGGEELLLADLMKALQEKGPFVTLKNGDQVLFPEELKEKLARLAKFSTVKNGKLLTHKTRAMLLDEWNGTELTTDEQFLQFKAKVAHFERILPLDPGAGFSATLREYQSLGLGWLDFLAQMEMGGCLADDMGLGKTVQVLAHLHRRFDHSSNRPSLIVCPKSLVFNWALEAKKFAPVLRVKVFAGGKWEKEYLECDILLMSYALMQRNIEVLKDVEFDYAILDEAQAIKNPGGLTTKASLLLKARHRLALTGTPVENHLGDLMSIFNFLIPGCFNSSMMKQGPRMEDLSFLRPFILRRKKEDVLKELPDKTVQIVYCDQTEDEKKYYQKLKKLARGEILNEKNKIQVLTLLMRLRQASCHLGLIDPKMTGVESGKLGVLKEMAEEIIEAGHKVLIFSQFTELLQLARNYLEMNEDNSCYLDGSSRKREEIVNEFKTNPLKKCFFISLKAGGTGLNLTEANYCFILDPWWNPAVENQAIDRIHRIGQKLPVNAYRLIAKDSIEEKVLELQAMKSELARNFMEGNEDYIQKLSANDLQFILS
ncbi:MAG: DEAD/DEAH box helicase [Bacteriovoracaceae bacterium]|nr:DEAD/DEAH box helicase [Bacteriovoracaceae bacterium]